MQTLLAQILSGRPGEADIRARFRASQPIRQPLPDMPRVPDGYVRVDYDKVYRRDEMPVQGRLSPDGLACYEL